MLDCVDARTSRAVTRTRSPGAEISSLRAPPRHRARGRSPESACWCRGTRRLDVRAVTRSAPSCPSSVIIASLTPSARYSDPGPGARSGEGENGERVDGGGCGRRASHDPPRGRDQREEAQRSRQGPPRAAVGAGGAAGLGRRFQRGADLSRLLVALAGVLPQAPLDDGAQFLRRTARQVGCWCLQDGGADVGCRADRRTDAVRSAARTAPRRGPRRPHADRHRHRGITLGRHVGQRPAGDRAGARAVTSDCVLSSATCAVNRRAMPKSSTLTRALGRSRIDVGRLQSRDATIPRSWACASGGGDLRCRSARRTSIGSARPPAERQRASGHRPAPSRGTICPSISATSCTVQTCG